jgi:hypothetical protein
VAGLTFDELQTRLVPLWKSIERMNQDEQTIVVVPSLTVDAGDLTGAKLQAYEERFLFLLLLLRQPRARLVYVTSHPILPSIVDYYLDLLPGVIPSHARKRLFLVAPLDGSARPLSQKLLERPRLLQRLRELIIDPERAHLVPYNTTELERDLAVALGIPMYGADPKHFHFGTKTGCRLLFQEEGIPHPIGRENLTSLVDAVAAIAAMRAERPGLEQVLLKLTEGVSGEGNARVDLRGLPASASAGDAEAIEERVRAMRFESTTTVDRYLAKLADAGGVVEELITGEEFRSPSVQLRVTPLGKVELLSTHDQLLGGPSGQTYIGCRFPADTDYAPQITAEAAKIGARLAAEGVIGRFALDFVTVKRNGGWDPYAIELNLRKGGTTHPYLTLQFLTDGEYDAERALFLTPTGKPKFFVSTDRLESNAYRVLQPDDVFDLAVRERLHFDHTTETGTVFHMMTALGRHGLIGVTSVGDSHAEARSLFDRTRDAFDREARDAAHDQELPPVD